MPVKVHRRWLFFVAGASWFTVGLALCLVAYHWLGRAIPFWRHLFWPTLAGSTLAAYFGLARIARRNVRHIESRPEKTCFFAFQPWRSYLLILVMMSMGITLRHSSFPRTWLALIYTFMGGALAGASMLYFYRGWRYWQTLRRLNAT